MLLREVLDRALLMIEQRHGVPDVLAPVPTGMPSLDAHGPLLVPGRVTSVVCENARARSDFLFAIASSVAGAGMPVLLLTRKDPEEVGLRLLAARTQLPYLLLAAGTPTAADRGALATAAIELSATPLVVESEVPIDGFGGFVRDAATRLPEGTRSAFRLVVTDDASRGQDPDAGRAAGLRLAVLAGDAGELQLAGTALRLEVQRDPEAALQAEVWRDGKAVGAARLVYRPESGRVADAASGEAGGPRWGDEDDPAWNEDGG